MSTNLLVKILCEFLKLPDVTYIFFTQEITLSIITSRLSILSKEFHVQVKNIIENTNMGDNIVTRKLT